MILKYLKGFASLPGSIKKRVLRYLYRKKLKLKNSDHDTIWTSVFLFLVRENAKLKKIDKQFRIYLLNSYNPLSFLIRQGSSSDVFTFFQLFIANEYEPLFHHLKSQRIKTILDCGANVGYFSSQALIRFPESYVISVEPANDNIEQLEKNLSINFSKERFTIMQSALWTHKEFLNLNNPGGEWAYQVHKSNNSNDIPGVPLTELINLFEDDEVDLLKIDVEGTEHILFKDELFLDSIKNKVKFLVLEIHDHLGDRSFIHDKLHENKFTFFEKGELTICAKRYGK